MSDAVTGPAVFLSTAPAHRGDRRLALSVAVLSLLIFVGLAPFSRVALPPSPAFIPAYESALGISDLMTAAILLIQFNILRSRAILALAAGYLFTALMVIPHALTFPGAFAPAGLLGAGPQTTAWLYVFWHGGFPLAVIAYVLLGNREAGVAAREKSSRTAVVSTVSAIAATVVCLTLLTTVAKESLPALVNGGKFAPALFIVISTVLVLCAVALALLWLRRPHTVLDLWLMVVMCAWLCDVTLSALLNAARFDLGFYAGRIYGLMAGTFVLLVLMLETGTLYARLAKLFEAEQIERRREAEERKRIVETSLDVILVVDRQGTVLRVSPSSTATVGYEPPEMIGRNARGFVHPDDLETIRSEMRRARHGQIIRDCAIRYVHKNGSFVMLSWSGIWSEPEQRHYFIGRDVTEQKRIERMKDEFIATVSHELRTPVTTICGPLNLLASGAAGELPPPVKPLVTIAHRNGRRLSRLIEDILCVDSIERGRTRFKFQREDVKHLVACAIRANAQLASQYGVSVRLDPAAAGADIETDSNGFLQVLEHLLSNAVKFSPAGSEVVVTIEPHDSDVRVAVRDRGPGIPDEYKTLIFEKFAQVDAADNRTKGGTGLGLNIVRETIARLGGRVGHGPAPSGGTIFHVDVPRWVDEAAERETV